ncbi:hypothetical protein ARALYDRAFT_899392 [Arabidopsis lyrata subsp. lyrata]|uniref:Uncharacterized protein n=2 Tax=Arabidopsis lyrata subsp. lyrata TaxID=81972 RepID=D7L9C0_ARALL|nr:hypothetical protein ARALYDRAFT_899392 [Arabidopsis lyrata subsp. lyrata]
MNSNGQRFAYGLGSSLANNHSLTILYSDFNHHPFANSSNAWTLSWLFCEFSKRSKPYALVVKQSSIDYITIVFRIFVVALLWVVHLAPARINASILSSTSQSLMTVTILSSFESFEDDLSINHDLTCVNVLPSSCLTALLVSKSMNFIYLLMALGNVFYCTALKFGSLKSFSLYLFLFG